MAAADVSQMDSADVSRMDSADVSQLESITEETKSLADRMQDLLNSARGFDVELVVGTDAKMQTFKAHKYILSASSSVFLAMFYGSLKSTSNVIQIPDVDPAAFQIVLRYMYTGLSEFSDIEDVCLVLYAAKKYLLSELIVQCRNFISNNLCAENVSCVHGFINQFEGEECLVEKCIQIMIAETPAVLSCDGFLRSDQFFIEKLLSEDHLNVPSEATLITALIAWAEAEVQRKKCPLNKENKRQVLEFAIPKIRFLSLTAGEFTDMKDMHDIFSPAEYCSVLSNILQPFPEEFCTDRKKRIPECEKLSSK